MLLVNRLTQVAISLISEAALKTQVLAPHLINYKKWLHEQAPSGLDRLDSAKLTQSIQ